jgi:hypothetical protein
MNVDLDFRGIPESRHLVRTAYALCILLCSKYVRTYTLDPIVSLSISLRYCNVRSGSGVPQFLALHITLMMIAAVYSRHLG